MPVKALSPDASGTTVPVGAIAELLALVQRELDARAVKRELLCRARCAELCMAC